MRIPQGVAFLAASSWACVLLGTATGGALAQEVPRGWSAYDLPRVGYEPRRIEIGRFVLEPEATVSENYDDNIFATNTGTESDWLTLISPRLRVTSQAEKLSLSSDFYADVRRYRDNDAENTTSYGGGVRADYSLTPSHSVTIGGRATRDVEPRGAPDEQRSQAQGPAELTVTVLNLGYRYRRNRLGLAASARADQVDFLDQEEADKDLSVYQGALRASYLLTPRFDVFLQAGAQMRDQRLDVDRNGRNRDAEVYSLLSGVAVDIAATVTGEFGAGVFHSTFEDPAFDSATGFAMNGSLTWAVGQRTSLTASASREDISTIRASAASNVQTRLGLRVEQEVYHNVLMSGAVQAIESVFEGSDQTELVYGVIGTVEYFINRGVSLVGTARYITQSADDPRDEYDRYIVGVGVRLRY